MGASDFDTTFDGQMALAAVVTVGLQLFFFFIAATLKIDKVTDLAGCLNFVLLALLSFLREGQWTTRQIVITVLVVVSRVELGAFLFYRVLKRGKDARFDEIRENFFKFFGFWFFQMMWVWGVSLPVLFVNSDQVDPDFGTVDIIGAVLAAAGWIIETVADLQKSAFRADRANAGLVCNKGLWSISRHPNFAGEIFHWWGIWMLSVTVVRHSVSNEGYAALVGPLLTMVILLFLSGMPTAEGPEQARFMRTPESAAAYLVYRNRTSPLLLLPPCVYAVVPKPLRCLFCCEFPMYAYSPKETDFVAGP